VGRGRKQILLLITAAQVDEVCLAYREIDFGTRPDNRHFNSYHGPRMLGHGALFRGMRMTGTGKWNKLGTVNSEFVHVCISSQCESTFLRVVPAKTTSWDGIPETEVLCLAAFTSPHTIFDT
jgi:hypothetical protein